MHTHRRIAALLLYLAPGLAGSYRFSLVWDGISMEGDRIRIIGACPPAAMDLSRYTAIPGMIDAHTHLTYILENPVSLSARRRPEPPISWRTFCEWFASK